MTFARQSLGSLAALVFGVLVSILLPRILSANLQDFQKVPGLRVENWLN